MMLSFKEFMKLEGMVDSDEQARNDLSPKGSNSPAVAPGLERKLKAKGPGGSPTSSDGGGGGGGLPGMAMSAGGAGGMPQQQGGMPLGQSMKR